MKKILLIASMIVSVHTNAQNVNEIATALFKDVKTKLTPTEKNTIAGSLGFVLSGNKEIPFAQDKESKDYPFGCTVLPTDLNKDGLEEIFVIYGNSFTSGNTGSSVCLFIKAASGKYKMNLGFPSTVPDALTAGKAGYPDLVMGGPGFEFPVWRWNGREYAYQRKITDAQYSKSAKTSIEELSKAYQAGIK